jgi:hypothetical protein
MVLNKTLTPSFWYGLVLCPTDKNGKIKITWMALYFYLLSWQLLILLFFLKGRYEAKITKGNKLLIILY